MSKFKRNLSNSFCANLVLQMDMTPTQGARLLRRREGLKNLIFLFPNVGLTEIGQIYCYDLGVWL
jgi:hypothetical protein